MPGILWLSLQPSTRELFPWWVAYLLDAMIALEVAILAFVLWCVISDIVREWRGEP